MHQTADILVVDTDQQTCSILKELLSEKGFMVETTYNVTEATERICTKFFHLVLIDIHLCFVEDSDFLEKLEKISPKTIPIIMSEEASLTSFVKTFQERIFSYIVKPLNYDTVIAVVNEALKKQKLTLEKARLLEELKRVNDKLKQWSEQLEERVDERTAELAAEKDRTEAILHSVPQGVVVLNNKERILEINPAAERLLGIEAKNILGTRLPITSRDKSVEPLLKVIEDRRKSPQEVSVERRGPFSKSATWIKHVTLKRPTRKVLQVIVSPLVDKQQHTFGKVFVFNDATKEHEADQLKTDFISLVSHELKTPLTSIIGFVSLLLAGKAGELTDLQKEVLDKVKRQSSRLTALINDLLDISRIETGKFKLRKERILLSEIAALAIEGVKPQADARKVQIFFKAPKDFPDTVADSQRIGQVFTNLLSNSIKFAGEGGRITVRLVEENNYLLAQVTDDGPGIPPRELSRIFDKFHQVGNIATRKERGSGLGLPIAKSIIEAHDGNIWVESEPGKFSRFCFSLPKIAPKEVPTLVDKKKVVVVDDEEDVQDMVKMTLESEQIEVITAYDGLSALDKVTEIHPDLILLDVMMPVLDGFEVCARLKKNAQTKFIPVIFFTGAAEEHIQKKMREVGAQDYILKPITPEVLEQKIAAFLQDTASEAKKH